LSWTSFEVILNDIKANALSKQSATKGYSCLSIFSNKQHQIFLLYFELLKNGEFDEIMTYMNE